MKRVRIIIEIDVRDDLRNLVNSEAVKLAAIANRRGEVVYVATEMVINNDRNIIISKD